MVFTVTVSDARASSHAEDVLVTYSLGSCIGVCLHDATAGVAGLLHYQLPSSGLDKAKAQSNPFMFADTGFARLLELLESMGANRRRLTVRLAGGAAMLNDAAAFNIGQRNHTAIRKILWQHGMFITSEDVGGNMPRTVYLRVADGAMSIKTSGMNRAAA